MPSSEKLFYVREQHLNHQNEFWVVNKIQNILARKYQILNIEKYGVFSTALTSFHHLFYIGHLEQVKHVNTAIKEV